jgi:tripartite-type tricarboxylate transporter receptor subunit TctC
MTYLINRHVTTTLAAVITAVGVLSQPVAAAPYFEGKTIIVQVPSGSGGTYHVYCQIVQRNIGRHIPGQPKTVIQNRPGGGGAKSAAYMAKVAPKNGSVIAMIAPGTITTPLVRNVKFNARKFNWLGAVAARSSGIWMWHTSGITTL